MTQTNKPFLKYHRKIYEELNIPTEISVKRLSLIEQREKICKVKFPESVKEFFSIENAENLFHDHTNEDNLVPVEELGDPQETSQGYLKVAYENQAVVGWYIRLNEGPDPAVYDNNDQWGEPLSKIKWVKCTNSFSEFIYRGFSFYMNQAKENPNKPTFWQKITSLFKS